MNTPTITLTSGHAIPQLGLGTWKSPETEVGTAVQYALETAGYTHIDCAKVYGNEPEVGQALHTVFSSGSIKREDVFITSKLWNADHDPETVEAVCRQTLADLQLEYLDLYLMHWGIAFAGGKGAEPRLENGDIELGAYSLESTWHAMEHLVELGLVRSIGVANFSTVQLLDMLSYAKVRPAMNQIELHPYNSQQALIDFCHKHSIEVTAYSPLGNRSRLQPGDPVLLEDPVVLTIASQLQKTPAQVLLRWAIQRETVVIPKSVTPARITENLAVFDFELSQNDMQALARLDQGKRFVEPSSAWGVPYFA